MFFDGLIFRKMGFRYALTLSALVFAFASFNRAQAQVGEQLESVTLLSGIVIAVEDFPLVVNPRDLPFPITVFPNPVACRATLSVSSSEYLQQVYLLDNQNYVLAYAIGNAMQLDMMVPEMPAGLYRVLTVAGNYGVIQRVQVAE
jgi:hypothetical protein